ncbi:MAG: CinA family protein [Chloroflexi bacterium]|nr:CinA family protein [Chloroflexota bacterium]
MRERLSSSKLRLAPSRNGGGSPQEMEAQVRAALGHHIYGVDDETIADVVCGLLRERGLTLATVELGSGGMLANVLGEATDAAAVYRGGLVVGPHDTGALGSAAAAVLAERGPASPEAAGTLASTAGERFHADAGLAIAAAPGPAPAGEAPPGTVHIALAWRGEQRAAAQQHRTTPTEVKRRAAMAALNLLRRALLETGGRA